MHFKILNSIEELASPIHHYDSGVFPDDSEWYRRFERHIISETDEGRYAYIQSDDKHDEILLPTKSIRKSRLFTQLESIDNYYSVDYRPICTSSAAHRLIKPMLTRLLTDENPDMLWLRALDPDAPETGKIAQTLESLGWSVYFSSQQVNWIHRLTGDYPDYLASRTGRLRSTLKRKTAKLMSLPGVELTVHRGGENIDQAIDAYNQIYSKSWKVPEPYPDFVPELIRATARLGQLRLGILRVDNVPVAVHFWIVKQQTAFIYKLAHDKAFDHYSPGTVLMGQMISYTIENDNINKLDFLSGDDAYKKEWMTERREKLQLIAYNPKRPLAQWRRYRDNHLKPFVKQFTVGRLVKCADCTSGNIGR